MHIWTMVILTKNAKGLKDKTFREYFAYYNDNGGSEVLLSSQIENWDDVVDNIKDNDMRRDATMNGCLFGPEYPPDTPITGGRKR